MGGEYQVTEDRETVTVKNQLMMTVNNSEFAQKLFEKKTRNTECYDKNYIYFNMYLMYEITILCFGMI